MFKAIIGILGFAALFVGTFMLAHSVKGYDTLNWDLMKTAALTMLGGCVMVGIGKNGLLKILPEKYEIRDEQIKTEKKRRKAKRQARRQSTPPKSSAQTAPAKSESEPQYSIEDRHLGVIWNGTEYDGFDWMFAHLDSLSDFYPIHDSLLNRGYPEIAEFSNRMFHLYCTAENVEGVDKVNLSPDDAREEFKRLETEAERNGLFERFNADMNTLFMPKT